MENSTPSRIVNVLGFSILFMLLSFWSWLLWGIPSLNDLQGNLAVPSIRITDRNGRILYEVIDQALGRNTPVPLESIPDYLILATIATEDHNFYQNPGVDALGIIRAFWINFKGGETLAGGSTITQQVARNLLLSEDEQFDRTIRRKLRESWLAWRLTKKYTKDEILSLYLNQIYYGALAYGVEAAAQTYFGKSVSELTLAECALIVGIPQGPAIFNPLNDPQAAQNRQNIVLNLMTNQGIISQDQRDLAIRQPLAYTSSPYPIEAPHFVMMVIAQLDRIIPDEYRKIEQALTVRTTLDLDFQQLAEKAVNQHLHALNNPSTSLKTGGAESGHNVPGGHNVKNASVVALNPSTGEVITMVGNHDYFDEDHNGAINMALSPRQPGSALKPFVYAEALNPSRQNPYTASTLLLDVNTNFTTHEGNPYSPANYDNKEHGPVSVRQALASSLNIPAVITLDDVGLQDFLGLVSKMGISSFGNPDNYDLSLALGGGEVSLLELSAAYGALSNGGFRLDPSEILDITSSDGTILFTNPSSTPVQVLDERVAWLISDILNDNDARSIGFSLNSALKIDRPAAVKTGTTTNYHDNWTLGYTPDIVVGVWVGNANHEPMRAVTGLSGAGPIWHQFIREALTGTPETWYQTPPGMTQIEVCALSGLLPTENCPYTKNEWYITGTEPTQPDHIYQQVWVDCDTGLLANSNTPEHKWRLETVLDLPSQTHPWAREQGIRLLSDLGISSSAYAQTANHDQLRIISPNNHAHYWFNPENDLDSQKIHIEMVSDVGMKSVELWIDSVLLHSFAVPPYVIWWPIKVGEHNLVAEGITQEGNFIQSQELTFTVEGGSTP